MIKTLYYYDLKEALRASFKNKIACYVDKKINTECWLSMGYIFHFKEQKNFKKK